MSDQTLRLFTAVPLPGALRHRLADWTAAHKNKLPFQKWSHPDDVHITLVFMGDTEERRLPGIRDSLRDAVAGLPSFPLRMGGTGTFGPPAAPSIFWAGLDVNRTGPLVTLQQTVQEALVQAGFPKEDRPYRPHITLARRYNGAEPWTKLRNRSPAAFPLTGTEWTCDRVTLYLSRLGRSPMYESVGEFPLA